MKRSALTIAAILLAATPAHAAHWTVDSAHSKLGFTVMWAKQPFSATFKKWTAIIDLDPANLSASKADVMIDIASMASGDPETDASIMGGIGFASDKFPTARFVTTRFTRRSGNAYVAQGNLTLKGVTRPMTLPFTLTIDGKKAHMAGSAVVMRNQFNVGSGEWSGQKIVARNVKVNIDIAAKQP